MVRRFLAHVHDDSRRSLAEGVLNEFETTIPNISHHLPKSIIHHDVNDQNILVSKESGKIKITGERPILNI